MRRISDMATVERSTQFQAALANVNTEWSKTRQSVVQLSSQLQVNVLPDLKAFDSTLSTQRGQAENRRKQFSQLQNTGKKLSELQIKVGGPEAAEMQRRHATELDSMAQTEMSFNASMLEFEFARLELLKNKMNFVLRSHLAYHAQCLETLSRALNNFNAIDSISEAQNLWVALAQFDAQNSIVANGDVARSVSGLGAAPQVTGSALPGAAAPMPSMGRAPSSPYTGAPGAAPGNVGYNGGVNMHMQPGQLVFSPSAPGGGAATAGAGGLQASASGYAQPTPAGLGGQAGGYGGQPGFASPGYGPGYGQQGGFASPQQQQPGLAPQQSFYSSPGYQAGAGVPAANSYSHM